MPTIIGTAGHIDHGKTALVRALTGQDTDRLKEEKERGISIDLGFAYMDLASGERVGIVDVPGHERFIRNMLAGAHAIDLVLLVVAADDGVMPQTEEHLDIVHLLGVSRAVVAISKADLVDAARLDAVRAEIGALLDGTRLRGAPMLAVSAVTGSGIDELRTLIEQQSAPLPPRHRSGYFRLPVDRVFVVHGHGTVVTGTAVAGRVGVGDSVRLLPGGEQARVRSVQVHATDVGEAVCGQRVALNLVGVEKTKIARGHVACDPRLDRVSDRFDAHFELRAAARRLKSHQAVRLYSGTAEALGKIILLDGSGAWEAKQAGYCQIVLREAIQVALGDRFIVRSESAEHTLGGGRVLNPFARRHRRDEPKLLERLSVLSEAPGDHASVLHSLLELSGESASTVDSLAQASGLLVPDVCEVVRGAVSLHGLPDAQHLEVCMTAEKWTSLQTHAVRIVTQFHQENPRAPGMAMESLRSQVAPDVALSLFRAVLDALVSERAIVRDDTAIRLPTHHVGLRSGEEALAQRFEALLVDGGFTPPSIKEIEVALGVASAKLVPIVQQMERDGRIVRVAAGMYFAAEPVQRAHALVAAHCQTHGAITAAGLRDLTGASRKFSIALLDYFDRTGFTLRIGDVRKLRR